jgi:hypothetical protein
MRLPKNLFLLSPAYVVIAVLSAQTPGDPDWQTAAGGKMAFEVASVRLAKPGTFTLPSLAWTRYLDRGDAKPTGGRFSASVPLGRYIFFAYKLEGFQIKEMLAQLPKWADDAYAINAKAEGNPTKDQMRLMMQSLLADRFKLRLHFATKEVPVLALTLVKPGKLGPKLRPHSEGPPCPDSFEMDKPFTPIPPAKPGVAWPPQCGNCTPERTALVVDPVRLLRAPLPTLLGVQTAGMSENRIPASEVLWKVPGLAEMARPPKRLRTRNRP